MGWGKELAAMRGYSGLRGSLLNVWPYHLRELLREVVGHTSGKAVVLNGSTHETNAST